MWKILLTLYSICTVKETFSAPRTPRIYFNNSSIEIWKEGDLTVDIINPDEEGSYVEGDIVLPEGEDDIIDAERNGMLAVKYRWPYAVVPFEIEGDFTNNELANLYDAMEDYHRLTCIIFVPHTTEDDYVAFSKEKNGCSSPIGRRGGRQALNLHSRCFKKYGTILHELMHTLGFLHEQNRYERDEYIQVLTENVKPDKLPNFRKSTSHTTYGFGVNYDYTSVMHYSSKSFSRNGQPTILPLHDNEESKVMGQRKGFSEGDLLKLNLMYDCDSEEDLSN